MSGKRLAERAPFVPRRLFGRQALPRLALMAAVLAACSVPPPSATPTATPISPTAARTETPVPTPTVPPYTDATPPIVLDVPLPSPTPLPPTPSIGLPAERLTIFDPGPGSQAVSPLLVTGFGGPSWQGRVRLRLIGEQGDVLADQTTFLQAMPDLAGRIYTELEFQFPWVAQTARLEVRTFSPRNGQMDHLTTRAVVLLTRGTALLYPGLGGAEKIAIFSPRSGALVRGNQVSVRGGGWLDTPGPLVVEVLDRNGQVVGSAITPLSTSRAGEVGSFEVQVPFEIPVSQYGRIAVYEPAISPAGVLHYNSVDVYLQP
jgi:hypothetical protein